MRKMGKFQ